MRENVYNIFIFPTTFSYRIEAGLDTSNFPETHPLYTKKKQSELGYFKSEVGMNQISVFAGIR